MTKWLPAACLLAATFAVGADEQVAPPGPAAIAEEATDSVTAAFSDATPVTEERLNDLTGKAQIQVDKIQINDQDLTGVVTDNTAIGNQTGHNTIGDGAYTDAAGFMTTVQNTGNNVLIQNATIINITVEP